MPGPIPGTIAILKAMPTPRRPLPCRIIDLALCACVASLWLGAPAAGQTLQRADESLLGLSEAELLARMPDLRRTGKPLPGPRGLRGLWSTRETTVQGLVLDTVVYLKARNVLRIEQRWISRNAGDCQSSRPESLAGGIQQRFGPAVVTSVDAVDDATRQYTTLWALGETEARLVLTRSRERCSALIVYAPHITQDASEL